MCNFCDHCERLCDRLNASCCGTADGADAAAADGDDGGFRDFNREITSVSLDRHQTGYTSISDFCLHLVIALRWGANIKNLYNVMI